MTDENDDTRRSNNDSEAQEGDPLGLYVGIQTGETFDGNEVFAVFGPRRRETTGRTIEAATTPSSWAEAATTS